MTKNFQKQNNRAVLTAVDHNGFTCAHIAAMKGSLAVVKELMMIDKVIEIYSIFYLKYILGNGYPCKN